MVVIVVRRQEGIVISYPPIEFSPRIQEKKLGIRKIFLHGFVFSIHGYEFPLTGLFFPLTGLFFPFTGLSFHSRVYSWGESTV